MADELIVRVAIALVLAPAVAAGQTARPISFRDAITRAAEQAPAVTVAALRTDEAGDRVREARAVLLPQLSATGGWLDQVLNKDAFGIRFPPLPGLASGNRVGPFDLYDARLHLTQSVLDVASLDRVRAASSLAVGTDAEREQAVELAARTAALAYLHAARARALGAARAADSTLAAEFLQLAQSQKDAGVGVAIDVTRAEAQLVAATGALVVARNSLERSRIDLGRALGFPEGTRIEPTDTLTAELPAAALPASRDSLLALARRHRPDLMAEQARLVTAQRLQAAIGAERLPRLDLSASYGANGLSLPGAIPTRQIALQVTLPLVDGFGREARMAEAQAGARASRVRTTELEQQIAADIDGALLDLESARQQGRIAAERLHLATAELQQARERFRTGIAGSIEVIDAQASLVRAQEAEVEARFAAAGARVELAYAVGAAHALQ